MFQLLKKTGRGMDGKRAVKFAHCILDLEATQRTQNPCEDVQIDALPTPTPVTLSSHFDPYLPPNQLLIPLLAFAALSSTALSNLSMAPLMSLPAFWLMSLAFASASESLALASADCDLSALRSFYGRA